MEKVVSTYTKNAKSLRQKHLGQKLFFWAILILPLVHFAVFYIFVNFRSIMFSFQSYDVYKDVYSGFGFDNFKKVINDIANVKALKMAVKNSLILYGCGLLMGTGFGLLFSFYIYKKYLLGEFFRVFLFLPQIISAVVLSIIYKYIIDGAIPQLWIELFDVNLLEQSDGLLLGENGFTFILAFTLWCGFGTSVLMYTSSMSGISESIVESASLDGVTPIKEFWFITLPMIYPTLVTFLTVGIAGIFTNQMNLFSFFGNQPPDDRYSTFGYYLYKEVQKGYKSDFPFLSSMGLMMTCIAVPLTLGIKYLLEKFGPSVD